MWECLEKRVTVGAQVFLEERKKFEQCKLMRYMLILSETENIDALLDNMDAVHVNTIAIIPPHYP